MNRWSLRILALAGCLAACACAGTQTGGGNNTTQPAAAGGAQAAQSDVEFAREAFRKLAAGDAEVEALIDWENFFTLGGDYGAEYRKLKTEDEKTAARRDFLGGFAGSFKEEGGDAEKVSNWREESKEGDETVVAADMPTGATLLMTVTREGGRRRISALEAEAKQ